MTPGEQHALEMRVLGAALDATTPSERELVIQRECAGNTELELRVRELLREHETESTVWKTPPAVVLVHLEPGDLLGNRFRIVRLLGEGGMGQVWAARDEQEQIDVALKVIRPELTADEQARTRFRQEVQLARRIGHPNVCRVYEIFEDRSTPVVRRLFLTMQLLHGETLAARLLRTGPLAANGEVRSLIRQLLDGVAAAHSVGIVHRDLKPGNIMLTETPHGLHATVMDFGLARSLDAGNSTTGAVTTVQTVLGTPDYMAPEQLAGLPVSPATDVYALGLTIYQMLTGQVPLKGRTEGETSILRAREQAPRLRTVVKKVDSGVDYVVSRCLRFDPKQRFPDAAAVLKALNESPRRLISRRIAISGATAATMAAAVSIYRSRRTTPDSALPAIGVVPFEPIGDPLQQQYLADGLTDQLLTSLNNLGIPAPARGSVFSYQGRSVPPATVAEELKVQWLLSGTLRLHGDRLMIYAQLVDSDGRPGKWSRSYDVERTQLGRIAADIASSAATAVAPTLRQRTVAFTRVPAANDLYLRGRYHFARRDPADQEQALALFQQAIRLDPSFALAHCGVAEALAAMADLRYRPAQDALTTARAAALEAIRLDPSLGHAYAVFANITALHEHDAAMAARYFEQAITQDPGDVLAYVWYSHLLLKMRRPEDCLRMAREAYRRDPLNQRVHFNAGSMAYFTRHYDEAYRLLRDLSRKAPDYYLIHEVLAEVCARLGKREEAVSEAQAALKESRHRGHALTHAAVTYAILGEAATAEKLLSELVGGRTKTAFEAVHVARAYAELRRARDAVHWLKKAVERTETGVQTVQIHHSYDPIRDTQDFKELAGTLPFAETP